ncbi:ImmA/IrrE family metallo-endopeptidase [Limosilactobacillus equigenerosi]|uniref:IrrE N-terminal-like domain-containing protein n=1 Tax=Limosilactobacillus equigenerosi DSM 18793 = JCM 14505 TaxID=1423742 RepID=A0A0R1UV28_9LACO|nr:ImmA/IrrE family metallo-endopeptidase [Limosilactobacillus equigenerosi]KRL93915.1 hypothetical protein FC21_GL001386 [Limosilactobacillus equigenerosi DSM 18793 = JCM 14505]
MSDLISWLYNFAFKKGISVEQTKLLSPDTPSTSFPQAKLIIINANWHDPNEIPFIIAHEIGHVINQDDIHSPQAEMAASFTALHLLRKYCDANDIPTDNSIRFCSLFGIPFKYDHLVRQVLAS